MIRLCAKGWALELSAFAIFKPRWVTEEISKITLAKDSQFLRRKALCNHKGLLAVRAGH